MFPALIEKLQRREDLTADEAAAAMDEIMEGRAAPAQIAGLLDRPGDEGRAAGRDRRPRADDARARDAAVARRHAPVFDTCGTGGDGAHTFNVSTVAALVARGVRRARRQARQPIGLEPLRQRRRVRGARRRHRGAAGRRRALPRRGRHRVSSSRRRSIRRCGTPAPTRRELGVRTAFNLLGPLTNPAGATRQLVGVPRPELTELVARALALLGSERAWVVHGADGLDEISTTGYTKVSECRDGAVNTFYLHPADVGLPKATPATLRGGDARRQRARSPATCSAGEPGAPRDIVLLNAGASLFIAGARRIDRRRHRAWPRDAIDRGRAADVLETLVRVSNTAPEVAARMTAADLLGDDRRGDAPRGRGRDEQRRPLATLATSDRRARPTVRRVRGARFASASRRA